MKIATINANMISAEIIQYQYSGSNIINWNQLIKFMVKSIVPVK